MAPKSVKASSRSAPKQSAVTSPKSLSDRNQATRRLTAFYVSSLSAIAGLSILGQFLIQDALKQQELDIQVISAAQQQKMQIPQMTRAAMLLTMSRDGTTQTQYQEALEAAIASADAWPQTMSTMAGDGRLSRVRRQQIQQMVDQLSPTHQQLMSQVQQSMSGEGGQGSTGAASHQSVIFPAGSLPGGTISLPGQEQSRLVSQQPPGQGQQRPLPGQGGQRLPMPGQRQQPPAGQQMPGQGQQRQGQGAQQPLAGQQMPEQIQPSPTGQQVPEQGTQRGGLLVLEQAYMRQLDKLMLTYNQQVAASTQYLKRLELGLLVVTLGVLALEGVFVFRPAVNKIRETMGALAESLQKTQAMAKRLDQEQKKSEKLLLNILPQPVAHRLKESQQAIADGFAEVSVLFADIVGFTQLSTTMPPQQLVGLLNEIFSTFDELAERHGLEKIKTIGDAYMVVGGLPTPRADHAEAIVAMAMDMQQAIAAFNQKHKQSFEIRIGINSGPVVAGVIGIKKFIYDLWGDTVNTASRMESHGVPGGIHITDSTYQRIKHKYHAESQGMMSIKGKGEMETYLVRGTNGEARAKTARVQKV